METAASHPQIPEVVAVIPTFKRTKLLLECLASLFAQTVPVSRIVLVDNAGGTDGAMAAVREAWPGHPAIEIHSMERNLGASGGFHAAVGFALAGRCDWVWFTDDDSEPEPDALEKLLAAEARLRGEGKNPVALSSVKYDMEGRIQTPHNGHFSWRQIPLPANRCRGIVELDYAAFTGVLANRRAIESQGNVRAEYFIWGDDLEFCLRLGKAGGIYLVADSRVLHKDYVGDPDSRLALGNFWRYYFGMRNWVNTARVHRGAWTIAPLFAACLYRLVTIWTGLDRKALRSRIIVQAFVDGVRGDFSRPVTPEKWQALIGGETYDPAVGR
jgi:dTDP-4-dehydrorhamnose reductase